MSGEWELTREALDGLLSWLDRDRERAGRRYETVRTGLVKVFASRGCSAAEDLADETINRVARKLPEIKETYDGKPEKYFYGVAKHLYQEYQRRAHRLAPLPDDLPGSAEHGRRDELTYDCLDKCLRGLPATQREIVRQYYVESTRPAQHEALAGHLGITLNALRVKVFRLVRGLRACVEECVGGGAG